MTSSLQFNDGIYWNYSFSVTAAGINNFQTQEKCFECFFFNTLKIWNNVKDILTYLLFGYMYLSIINLYSLKPSTALIEYMQ